MKAIEQMSGHITGVFRVTLGHTLATAASIGDTVLYLAETSDYDESGGHVLIGDVVYEYLTVDGEAKTLTLATPLTVAAEAEDPVDVFDPEVRSVIAVGYEASFMSDIDDPTGRSITVGVHHGLVSKLDEGTRGGSAEAVSLVRDGDHDWMIWQIDGRMVFDILVEEAVAGIDMTLVQLNEDLDELNTVTLPALQADLATLDGMFPITEVNISDDAITAPKLAANSVSADHIIANAVGADEIAANSISADHIIANSIGADELAANSVTANELQANAIDGRTITGVTISGGAVYTAGVGNNNGWVMTGAGLIGPNFTTTVSASGVADFASEVHAGSGFHDDGLDGGGLTAASIGNGGRIVRTTSSERYKKFIQDAAVDTDAVLNLQPRRFKRRAGDQGDDQRWYLGLVAEEVEASGCADLVFHNAEGQVEGVHYADALVVSLLAVCQTQQAQIDALTARLDAAGL